jgi:hypothetical protein
MLKKIGAALLLALGVVTSASAVPPTTVAELTAGISFADVSLGVLAVAALLAAIYVTWRSVKFVMSAVKSM